MAADKISSLDTPVLAELTATQLIAQNRLEERPKSLYRPPMIKIRTCISNNNNGIINTGFYSLRN